MESLPHAASQKTESTWTIDHSGTPPCARRPIHKFLDQELVVNTSLVHYSDTKDAMDVILKSVTPPKKS
jgi:hypothetical protein